jgi:hypothetical protein
VRWRLAGLASPDLPEPLAPALPVVDPDPLRWHMKAGGLTLFLPDTFPTPSRDELRRLTQTFQDRRTPDHLRGWAQIKTKQAQGGAGARRYAHLLLVHHWLGILETRHGDRMTGRTADIQSATAQCLGCKRESVRKLCYLRRRRLSTTA